jgi:hypothetical protein
VESASAQVETVVVTAERRTDYDAPHVYIVKRADFLITKVQVTCDTRELSMRRNELKETLRAMIRTAANTRSISLGVGDEIVTDLNESNFDEIIEPDARADTSTAYVIVKTVVSKDDTYNAATTRIKEYVDKTPKVGRTLILLEKSWNLTLVGPEQYRDALVAQIVTDAKHTADLFGAGNGVTIEGLEHRVTWFQKTSLDLGLYIPYTLHIAPLNSH